MPLIVEDGSGLPNADSYVSLVEFRKYLNDMDLGLPDGISDAETEAALRRGSLSLDLMYGHQWLGRRMNPDQSMDWGRVGVVIEGGRLASSPLPRALLFATCEAAWREAASPGLLLPDKDPAGRVTSESVGPLSVSYATPSVAETNGAGVTFTVLDRLLRRLVDNSLDSGSGFSVSYLRRG